MKLPKQAKPVMRKVGAVNHFGLGMRPSSGICPPEAQNEHGECYSNNRMIGIKTCDECCGLNNATRWRGLRTGTDVRCR